VNAGPVKVETKFMIEKLQFGNSLRNERGFGLIEVLMAMALLGLGIFAVMGTTTTVMDKNNESKMSSVAMTLAQDKVEYIKGVGQAWLLSGADGLDSPDLVSGVWTANAGGETVDSQGDAVVSGYGRSWTITDIATENFLYDITVNMTWQDGGTQTLQLNTQITQ
jgi:prepilin-type N-terminal cleavage/methylation domain-containing protein